MLIQSNYRIHVLDSYQTIQEHINQLHAAILEDDLLGTWIQEFSTPTEQPLHHILARQRAFNSLSQLEYLPLQAPREIIICAGFLGASDATLEIVRKLNNAKQEFKKAILSLKTQKISIHDDLLNSHFNDAYPHPQRDSEIAKILKKSGLARLHLKQCYRKIPILDSPPISIRWTWAHTRSIKRITVAQAFEKLSQRGKKSQELGIQLQLKKLATLSENTPLAIVQELAPHLRTNIVFNNPNGDKTRLMIKGSVPIFYPADLNTPLPLFKPPSLKCDKHTREIRSDVQLDPIPLLPSIRAHRYLCIPDEVLM